MIDLLSLPVRGLSAPYLLSHPQISVGTRTRWSMNDILYNKVDLFTFIFFFLLFITKSTYIVAVAALTEGAHLQTFQI